VDGSTIAVVLVIFLSTLIRSALGFGEALVAVPLLALLVPVEVVAPLAVLFSITVAAVVVIQDWHKVQFESAWKLFLSTLLGIPLGLLLLTKVPESVVKGGLAVVIIAFSTYCLRRVHSFELKSDRMAWLFGFAAGILGGAYGMNGPPLVVYGALRRWSPELSAGQRGRHGWLLAGRAVGACRDPLLPDMPGASPRGHIPRPVDQSTPKQSTVRALRSWRPDPGRGDSVGPVALALIC
jgi:hypothetical protein